MSNILDKLGVFLGLAVSYGSHGTSGMKHIDYYFSCDITETSETRSQYTEELLLLDQPPTFQPRMKIPETFSRSELGLPEKGAIYFCPHRQSKYHPDYDFHLKGILKADPDGHIVVSLGNFSSTSEKFKERMRLNLGKTLFKRLIFVPKMSVAQYFKLLAVSTAILDSHIFSGGITAFDAFSFGTPCVTQAGQLSIQRYPLPKYKAMGIEDAPIAANRREYVAQAVRLGTDPDYGHYLTTAIRERSGILFEQDSVVKQFEQFFEIMTAKNH